MNFKVNFILPSKSRPDKFFATLQNIQDKCTSENYEVICILEQSDALMNNQFVKSGISLYPFAKPFFVNSTGKINAINLGIQYLSPDYDILVLIADDIEFTEIGFDNDICCDMQQYFPKLDGLLHYSDGSNHGKHIVALPVCGKEYIKYFGYVYHPSYISLWPDNELLLVAKYIDKYQFRPTRFYKHNHPENKTAKTDELYEHNQQFNQQDKDNYFKRLAINFEL